MGPLGLGELLWKGRKFEIIEMFLMDNLRFVREGGKVTMCDLPTSQGAALASSINSENCIFVPTDITNPLDVENALLETKVECDRMFPNCNSGFCRTSLVAWMPL